MEVPVCASLILEKSQTEPRMMTKPGFPVQHKRRNCFESIGLCSSIGRAHHTAINALFLPTRWHDRCSNLGGNMLASLHSATAKSPALARFRSSAAFMLVE